MLKPRRSGAGQGNPCARDPTRPWGRLHNKAAAVLRISRRNDGTVMPLQLSRQMRTANIVPADLCCKQTNDFMQQAKHKGKQRT